MVRPEIADGALTLHIEGADKIWALKSQLRIPLQHIVGVRLDADIARSWLHGFRMPGTEIPGVLTAGTFYQHGQRIFWDVHHPERSVVIALRDETYNELVIEVEDPAGFLAQLQAQLPTAPE